MKKALEIVIKFSNVLMLPIIFFYWVNTSEFWNLVAIGLLILALLQVIIRNKILGIILATLFSFSSLFLFFALISELNDFSSFDKDAAIMATTMGIYLLLISICSGLMYYKYLKSHFILHKSS